MIFNRRLNILIVVEVVLVIIMIVAANINHKYFSVGPSYPSEKIITINPGTSISKAAEILSDSSVIVSKEDFLSFFRYFRRGKDIKFGVYKFDHPVSIAKVFDVLNEGQAQLVKFTIPEGTRLREIAGMLSAKLGYDSLRIMQLATDEDFCLSLGAPAKNLEGFLLPETYFFDPLTEEKKVLGKMVKSALHIYKENQKAIKASGWTDFQIATMASLVEGECQVDSERGVVASVYFNRLAEGMPLQADPTIQYIIKGEPRRLRLRDLAINSPYNTYKHKGLPPGPINNPGEKSILASIYPDSTEYLYFVARGDGGHYFATTYGEHLKNKEKFDRVRRRVFYEKRKKRGS